MTFDYASYIAGLPKVLAGAAAVFRDGRGHVLIVKPNYLEDGTWLFPGGTVESGEGESPRQGAARETLEEIGLDVRLGPLLAVDWVRGTGRPPLVSYLFDGGVLGDEQLAAIRLQEEELTDWRTVPPADLPGYLAPALARRALAALAALETGRGPVELEDGLAPEGVPAG
ncbi:MULTISPECIES: NUDIX hydrolase [Streptomyces]|uniref:NUDIX hydrolase n=1 Tax=Streptomyces lycii TaxID=2654337 RepID=A0ABQ7FGR1_9ACTN|nr:MULTISPECIES: NUDIX hydrolase [Streptomyces]KAF4406433.1 NUDIX hydrolase [Streptomyces lycii]PGH47843.1 NUDIX hydrolase [Streptomyces sp. Ru87]